VDQAIPGAVGLRYESHHQVHSWLKSLGKDESNATEGHIVNTSRPIGVRFLCITAHGLSAWKAYRGTMPGS
jgi:hypothetical protein